MKKKPIVSRQFSIVLVLLAMVVIAGCHTEGKQTGMAVINSKEVVTKCNAGIQVSQDIQHEFADRQSDLKKQEEAIRQLQNDPALSDPKSGKKDELQRLVNAYVGANQQFRQDVTNVETAKYKPVLDKINKVLAEYAKAHGLLSIQDKNGFAYVDPSIDITETIIKQVDQEK
jgi:outer membrane protein